MREAEPIDDQLERGGLCVDWPRAVELMHRGATMRRIGWPTLWQRVYHDRAGLCMDRTEEGITRRYNFWPTAEDRAAKDWQIV